MELQNYKMILVGIDGSEQANLAFKKAIEVAKRNNGQVVVTNVIESRMYTMMGYSTLSDGVLEQEESSAHELLNKCVDYAKSVSFDAITTIATYGEAKEVMTRELPKEYHIDLIIVGQSGLNAIERFITGSVSNYVVQHAPCDVLIVHPDKEKNKQKA